MLKDQSLIEFALKSIRDGIQSGRYMPGDKLRTVEIANDLSVSRTPVVAAINRLVAEGLAESIPNRGTFVKKLSMKQVHDMLQVRLMIEQFSIPFAVKNLAFCSHTLSFMESLLVDFQKIGDSDYKTASELEHQFHSSLVSLACNDQLSRLFEINWGVGAAFYLYNLNKMPLSIQKKSFLEHKDIIALLKKGDEAALHSTLERHISSVISAIDWLYMNDKKGIFK